jgi:hypothetical protein
MLGTLENPNDPKNNNNNNKAVWELKRFQLIILGRLLKLKIGFIAAQNLRQHGKMFRSFLSYKLSQFAENLRKCFQGG